MPEIRPHKRLRRQITETSAEDDNDASSEYNLHDQDTIYVKASDSPIKSTSQPNPKSAAMSRPRRSGASAPSPAPSSSPAVTVSRSPSGSPEENRKSIKLNFKMPASKLREVTGVNVPASQRKNVSVNSRDSFEGGEIITGPRSSRTQKKVVKYQEYDEDDDDEEEEEEEEEEDAEGDEDDEMDDFDQIGAEAEGGTDDEDIEMEDAPVTVKIKAPKPPPAAVVPKSSSRSTSKPATKPPFKPALKVTKPVEEKEMELDPEDDELSEIERDEDDDDEDDEDEDEEDEEEEDAEGEEDDEMNGDTPLPTAGDEELLEDSEDELANGDGSRGSTPDYAKLTKRQRGKGEDEGSFLALPMEPQIKKHFTAEEHRMRRAEMARRRKNLSEKRNEEEKMTTINKLLKKQTTKQRGKALKPETLAAQAQTEGNTAAGSEEPEDADEYESAEIDVPKANPLYVRWVNNKDGIRLGVPVEWLGKSNIARGVFRGLKPVPERKLVDEV